MSQSKAEIEFRSRYPHTNVRPAAENPAHFSVFAGDYLCSTGRTIASAFRYALDFDESKTITPDPAEISTIPAIEKRWTAAGRPAWCVVYLGEVYPFGEKGIVADDSDRCASVYYTRATDPNGAYVAAVLALDPDAPGWDKIDTAPGDIAPDDSRIVVAADGEATLAHGGCPSEDEMSEEYAALSPTDKAIVDALPKSEIEAETPAGLTHDALGIKGLTIGTAAAFYAAAAAAQIAYFGGDEDDDDDEDNGCDHEDTDSLEDRGVTLGSYES